MDSTDFASKIVAYQEQYHVSEQLLVRMSRMKLVILVGPTGVGKTTILEQTGIPYLRSDVTRAPRLGERDGIDYNFRTDQEGIIQDIEAGEFIQFLIGHTGEFYGLHGDSLPTGDRCILAVVASSVPVFERLGFGSVIKICILPPSYEEWMRRLRLRGADEIESRLLEAVESLRIVMGMTDCSYVINDDYKVAATEVCELVESNYCLGFIVNVYFSSHTAGEI